LPAHRGQSGDLLEASFQLVPPSIRLSAAIESIICVKLQHRAHN
jgi:hypothetical protein